MSADLIRPTPISPLPGSRRRGFSLVETVIVLGVTGLLVGGIWVAVATVSSSMKRTALISQTNVLVFNLRQYYASRPLPQSAVLTIL